jgi:hypothetical protein
MRSRLLMTLGALAAVLVAGACVAPPPPPQNPGGTTTTTATTAATIPPAPACPATPSSSPGPDSQNPISSWGVNGTANTTVVIGDIVYVGGTFNQAVGPNAGQTASRTNLAAFCLANGNLLSTFVANLNGQVWALTTDGTSLFVGGDFTTLNGAAVPRLVKLDPLTGARIGAFNPPAIPNVVLALDYFGGNVYMGCDCSVGANPPLGKKGASLNATTGAFSGWNPDADAKIESIKVSPSGTWVYIGGAFQNVQGQAHDKLAKLARSNSAVQSVIYSSVGPGVVGARVFDIAVNPADENQVVTALGPKSGTNPPPPSGAGNRFVYFNATGAATWNDTEPDGDAQAVELIGPTVYAGFHDGWSGDHTLKLVGLNLSNGQKNSFGPPIIGGILGVFDLAQGSNRLVAVGDFASVGTTTKLHGVAIFN